MSTLFWVRSLDNDLPEDGIRALEFRAGDATLVTVRLKKLSFRGQSPVSWQTISSGKTEQLSEDPSCFGLDPHVAVTKAEKQVLWGVQEGWQLVCKF